MKIIAHRRNTIEQLRATPNQYGIEVDIRSNGKDLIVHHDPFSLGEKFEDWILAYHHETRILNVKEEGLEIGLLEVMKSHAIENFFFLDNPDNHANPVSESRIKRIYGFRGFKN